MIQTNCKHLYGFLGPYSCDETKRRHASHAQGRSGIGGKMPGRAGERGAHPSTSMALLMARSAFLTLPAPMPD